jgi:hypothetical protein
MECNIARAASLGGHNVVRRFAIKRITLTKQGSQFSAWVRGLQQWPVLIAGSALELTLYWRF